MKISSLTERGIVMAETIRLAAFLVANQLDIKGVKTFLELKPVADSSSELFYSFGPLKYQYYTNHGVVVFSGYGDEEMKYALKAVASFYKDPVKTMLKDELSLSVEPGKDPAFEFNRVMVGRIDET